MKFSFPNVFTIAVLITYRNVRPQAMLSKRIKEAALFSAVLRIPSYEHPQMLSSH